MDEALDFWGKAKPRSNTRYHPAAYHMLDVAACAHVLLGEMPLLKYLDLTRTRVSDRSIDYLAGLPSLEDVILRRCKITAEGAQRLRELRPDIEVHWQPLTR